ncbi:hypothetical protein HDU79_003157 [Rhizoclosmatium sp. JEL0117]|nr:hypothetical protein HDU79_003157 [Rhizoclosmatium sp. JEL0117]
MSRLTASPELSHPVHQLLDNTPSNKPEPIPVFKGTDATFLEQGRDKRIAFVLQNFLTAEECTSLIAATEELGYEQALLNIGYGRQILDESVRKSKRCIVDSVPLADKIWERIKSYVPQTVPFGNNTLPDGSELSVLTLQLYLNVVEEGGETTMWSDRGDVEVAVPCEVGKAIVFSHPIEHEGSEVTRGVKYVMRSDIMYSRQPLVDESPQQPDQQ